MPIKDKISHASPGLRFSDFSEEFLASLKAVIKSGNFINGPHVYSFEQSLADFIGAKYAVGVNSGTDALQLSLMALNIGKNDEVITSALTAPATIIAILNAGATPVIVDVVPPEYCISAKEIEKSISKNTKAIIPVHLHGYASPMKEIVAIARKYNLEIIEDCAQSIGTTLNHKMTGTFGKFGALSFYPTKNLGAIGDAGAIVTNNKKLFDTISILKNYGHKKGVQKYIGINSRMDELQAAFLSVMLPKIKEYNNRRAQYAKLYSERLVDYSAHLPPIIQGATYHQYVIRLKNRDRFRKYLYENGVKTNIHYDFSMNALKFIKKYCHQTPIADKVTKEFVSLPIQPEILDVHFEKIIEKVKLCLGNQ